MTIIDAHREFKIRYDKLDALLLPNLLSSEIDILLNQSQDRLVKQRYGKNNIKKEPYEETQKRSDDLKAITVNAVLLPSVNAVDNIDTLAQFVILPLDYWFIVQERVSISYTDCTGATVNDIIEVRPIEHNEFSKVIKDPFKKPNNTKVLRLMEANRVELIPALGVTLTDYKLRYIKEPRRVSLTSNVTFELSSHLHSEIVDEAVKVALELVESKRINTFIPIVDNTKE